MFLFIWHDVAEMSDNYHDNGGVGVIAETLEKARELLGMPWSETYTAFTKEPLTHERRHVPESCDAFTSDPDETIELAGNPEPKAWTWPNAGCC